jgi:hypothetical protein
MNRTLTVLLLWLFLLQFTWSLDHPIRLRMNYRLYICSTIRMREVKESWVIQTIRDCFFVLEMHGLPAIYELVLPIRFPIHTKYCE